MRRDQEQGASGRKARHVAVRVLFQLCIDASGFYCEAFDAEGKRVFTTRSYRRSASAFKAADRIATERRLHMVRTATRKRK